MSKQNRPIRNAPIHQESNGPIKGAWSVVDALLSMLPRPLKLLFLVLITVGCAAYPVLRLMAPDQLCDVIGKMLADGKHVKQVDDRSRSDPAASGTPHDAGGRTARHKPKPKAQDIPGEGSVATNETGFGQSAWRNHLVRARMWRRLDDSAKADRAYIDAVKAAPSSVGIDRKRAAKAEALYALDDFDGAARIFEEAFKEVDMY
jgi:hypothetical protein